MTVCRVINTCDAEAASVNAGSNVDSHSAFDTLYDLVHLLARVSEDLVALLCQVSFHHVIQLRVAHPWAVHAYRSEGTGSAGVKNRASVQAAQPQQCLGRADRALAHSWTLGPHPHKTGRKLQVLDDNLHRGTGTGLVCENVPSTLAVSKPSEKSMISQICSRSGTTMVTGLKRAFRLSGSSVRPAYPGFMALVVTLRADHLWQLMADVIRVHEDRLQISMHSLTKLRRCSHLRTSSAKGRTKRLAIMDCRFRPMSSSRSVTSSVPAAVYTPRLQPLRHLSSTGKNVNAADLADMPTGTKQPDVTYLDQKGGAASEASISTAPDLTRRGAVEPVGGW
ncbi:MAG: hypothetical protein FRX49_04078 [Trebouxia sp. A1-2]|nr:MAG: hypothetical protein FRX49_04078 [Trebouxia sp. A1-2]